MKIIDFIRCTFFTHEPPEEDEDRLFITQYGDSTIHTKCTRCNTPVMIWRNDNCKDEDHYWIQET